MSLISFSEVGKFYGRQDVLAGVTLALNPGDRIGLVGRNGAGKTTLIRLIMGQEQPDQGLISRAKGLRAAYLPQDLLTFSGQGLLELVMNTARELQDVESELAQINAELAEKSGPLRETPAGRRELEELVQRQSRLLHLFEALGGWSKEAEAKKILSGLGFEEKDFGRDIGEFSGGWIMRAALARLLLAEPEVLILDEPTNHLDLDSLMWLEEYLKAASAAVLLVSHDRTFLNNVCRKIVELSRGRATLYPGDYETYLAEKEKRLAADRAAFANQQDRIRQMEKFIERNRTRASTARRAQSRLKTLEKMDRLSAPEDNSQATFALTLPKPARGPEIVAELMAVAKYYGHIHVYEDLNLRLRRGDRLALIGPNGRGKSTLIRMMIGLERPTRGRAVLGQGVTVGYFAQFQMDNLHPEHTVIDELALAAGDLGQGALRSILGSFLFSGDEVFKKVSVLSGGEKARLALAKIMLAAPNLLVLDEPTNHLDIQGRQMLEEALDDFSGAICLISHDRSLINRLAREIGIIENGRLTTYPGNFDDYQNLWQARAAAAEPAPAPAADVLETPPGGGRGEREARKKAEARQRQALSAQKKPLLAELARQEDRLAELSRRLQELTGLLAAPETYQEQSQAKSLTQELGCLKDEQARLEKNWEKTMLALESLGG